MGPSRLRVWLKVNPSPLEVCLHRNGRAAENAAEEAAACAGGRVGSRVEIVLDQVERGLAHFVHLRVDHLLGCIVYLGIVPGNSCRNAATPHR